MKDYYTSVIHPFFPTDNGNIDLMKNKDIINVPDLKRKLIAGDKSVNMIKIHNDNAYLATGIGRLVVNLTNNEFRD